MARRKHGDVASDKTETPKAAVNKENLKQALIIFKYVKPYRWVFITGLLFIALSSATTMAFPYLLKVLIENAEKIRNGELAVSPGTIALYMLAVLGVQMFFSFMRIYL